MIKAYKTKMDQVDHNLVSISSMHEKLLSYRNITTKIVESDRRANLKDLQDKLGRIFNTSINYFSER